MSSPKDRRRQNLNLILASLGGHGGQKRLSEKSGVHHSYLSNIRQGNREMGEEVARKIETALGLMPGWMDQPRSEAREDDDARYEDAAADREGLALEERLLALWRQLSLERRRMALEMLADMVVAEQRRPPRRPTERAG